MPPGGVACDSLTHPGFFHKVKAAKGHFENDP
jgi:hypothetical protein